MLYVTFVTLNIILRHPKRDASKKVQTPTVSEFDMLARFREMIPTVKLVLSSKIQRINFEFLTEIMIFPFLRKLDFLGSYTLGQTCVSPHPQSSSVSELTGQPS